MSRHIVDTQRRTPGSSRAQQFTRIDAGQIASRQTKALQRRPSQAENQSRVQRFLAIDRRSLTRK